MTEQKQCCLCGGVGHDSKDCGMAQRAEFEAWAKSEGFDCHVTHRAIGDFYSEITVAWMWKAWQAARAQPAESRGISMSELKESLKQRHSGFDRAMKRAADDLELGRAIREGHAQPAGEAVAFGPLHFSTSESGRKYVAEFFTNTLRRHDFTRYINERLAADFACTLARALHHLQTAIHATVPDALSKRCYVMSESHLSGHRLIIGFSNMEDAQNAHEAMLSAATQPTQRAAQVPDDGMVNAAFEAMELRGFRVGASDIGMDDMRAILSAALAAAPVLPPESRS